MDFSTSTDPTADTDQFDDWSGDVWAAVLRSLRRIVPYIDVEDLDWTAAIQDEADLDSLDFIHMMAAVTDETGVDIPERDYPLVGTLAGLAAYVAARLPTG
jgi:acyl carrier protein